MTTNVAQAATCNVRPASITPARPRAAPPYFHVLAKPTGAICNLDCKYCFFLSKEALYPGSRFRMSDEVLEAYVRQMIEGQLGPHVSLAFQGGEPTLMGLDFFRRAVGYAQKHARPNAQIEYSLQTNGTLLDEAWCDFFRQNNFLIGLSLDGPQPMHDAYRVDKGGAPTFNKVMRAARLMQQHQVEFNILCTVHAANAPYPLEVYRFFRDEVEAQFIQFIPIVERAAPTFNFQPAHPVGATGRSLGLNSLVTERSVGSAQWGQFLIAIFDEWVRRDVGRVFVQMFDAALAAWVGASPALCIFAETCGNALALEHNGDLYACDHYVEPNYLLGNITRERMIELVASDKQRGFGADKRDRLPRCCRECDVRFACQGECPRNRFVTAPGPGPNSGEPGLNYLCAGLHAFFRHVDRPMRIMADLLSHQRAPAEIMQMLAHEETRLREVFAQAGRNDPCPCGSGKKFKQCHGRSGTTG